MTKSVLEGGFVLPTLVALVGLGDCEKGQLDDEVRRLCAIDGGVRVYEEVTLPPERFDKFGSVRVPAKKEAKPTDDFYYERDITYYRQGNPEMWRNHVRLIRRSDGKLLGEAIRYSRRCGDMPGPWQSSSFACPIDAGITVLQKRVFFRGKVG